MNAASAMLVGIRLIAIYLLVVMIQQSLVTAEYILLSDASVAGEQMQLLAIVTVGLAVSGGLWFLAPIFARSVATPTEARSGASISAESLQCVALSVLGVWLVVTSLPYIPGTLLSIIGNANGGMPTDIWEGHKGVLLSLSVEIIAGLLLIFRAGAWSRMLCRVQEFGLEKKR